jgi:type I restriction enzyme S subunit
MVEARIGDLAEQVRGVTYGKEDASKVHLDGYLPVLRAGNITETGLTYEDLVYVPAAKISDKQKIRQGDIIVAASSGSLDMVGKAAPALNDFDGGFGAFCKVLRPNKKVHPRYFAQLFKRPEYRRTVSSLAAGANINNLRNEHLDEMRVPVPSLDEQRRIADILDQADALRAKRREALVQLEKLTQSIFIEMFGDPGTNSMMWSTSTVAQLAEQVTDGEHLTPKREPAGIKLLSARNVRDGFIDFGNVDYVGIEEHQRIKKRCNPIRGDLLISCSGSIGRVASVETDEPFSLVRSVAMIRPKHELVLTKYLEHYLRTPAMNAYMIRRANASSQANLFQGPIREMPVMLPTYALQQAFSTLIQSVGELKVSHQEALEELGRLSASLQHRAFRGEL